MKEHHDIESICKGFVIHDECKFWESFDIYTQRNIYPWGIKSRYHTLITVWIYYNSEAHNKMKSQIQFDFYI